MAAVGGLDPSVLVAPDYQTQMMQAQRRLALAQQLQQQSMQDTPGNGGSISWTQGLARVADALVGGLAAHKGYKQMQGANQAYAAGLSRMFGMPPPQSAQGAPPPAQAAPTPPTPPQVPQQAPAQPGPPPAPGLGNDPNPVANGVDPLAVQVAPPQAASPPPSASSPPAPTGGANYPMNLTGDPHKDFMLYMENPEEFSKAQIANAAKGGAPTDLEVTLAHARKALAEGDVGTASALLSNVQKQNYIAPASSRPGGWTQNPQTQQWEFHPQAPIPGSVPGPPDKDGNMTWRVPAGVEQAVAERAQSQAGGEASGRAPYQFQQVFNKDTGQMEYKPVSEMAGGGGRSLNNIYGHNGASAAQHGGFAAAPALGQQEAYGQYGKHSADAFDYTQGIARESPQRVQALREMQSLISGPNPLNTGPTAAKMQQLAEDHGLTFLAKDNAFVFNKDAARFIAQSASDLGLNGSDARLGMMANASPTMKMTPHDLKTVLPTMIGLEYAKMAKATAAAKAGQTNPAGNAQFESQWRQAYDPRMFTAYAQGGPQALAHAPANLRQQWLKDYRTLKGMGVDFTRFAQ